MNARDTILAAGFLLCLTGPALADKVAVLTSYDCNYLNDVLSQKDGYDRRQHIILYVAGYLSGVAVASDEDFLRGVSFTAIEEEVTSQCKLRPKALIVEVAHIVEKKLRAR